MHVTHDEEAVVGRYCVHTIMLIRTFRIEDPQVVKAGKCQFQKCNNDFKVGGTRHYDSYIFSGNPLAIATTTTTGE